MDEAQYQFLRNIFLSLLLSISLLLSSQYVLAVDLSRTTHMALHFQTQKLNLNFSGDIRKTRFYSVDLVIRERLTERLDGAVLLGHVTTDQSSNPILAGQDTTGGYAGLDLRYKLIDTHRYDLLTRAAYQYSETEANIEDQDIIWEWHQAQFDLINRFNISNNLYINLGATAYDLDGREKASGTLDQNTDFDAKDGIYGHLSLQFNLDYSGQIDLEVYIGSIEGGRIAFHRAF